MLSKYIIYHLKSVPFLPVAGLDLCLVFGVRRVKTWPPEAQHPQRLQEIGAWRTTTLKAVNVPVYNSRMASSLIPTCDIKSPKKLLAQTIEAGTFMDVT